MRRVWTYPKVLLKIGGSIIHGLAKEKIRMELLEEILHRDNLNLAFKKVVSNKGVDVDKGEIMLEAIKEVGPANHYLEDDTTLENYRDVWYPELYSRNMVKDEKNYLHNKINDKINNILINHKVSSLSQDKIDIIEKYEKIWQSRY